MARLGGMDELRRRAGGGEGRRDLARDVAALAHAGDDDPAMAARIMPTALSKLSLSAAPSSAFSALRPSASNWRVRVADSIASLLPSRRKKSRFRPTGMIVLPLLRKAAY